MKNREIIRKKFGPYFIAFFVITFFLFFIFPKQLVGNIYVITAYGVGCVIFLLILNEFKKGLNSKK